MGTDENSLFSPLSPVRVGGMHPLFEKASGLTETIIAAAGSASIPAPKALSNASLGHRPRSPIVRDDAALKARLNPADGFQPQNIPLVEITHACEAIR